MLARKYDCDFDPAITNICNWFSVGVSWFSVGFGTNSIYQLKRPTTQINGESSSNEKIKSRRNGLGSVVERRPTIDVNGLFH